MVDNPIKNEKSFELKSDIKDLIIKDHAASKFAELGKKLLEETNRPNVITFSQFEPFIPLFNADKARMEDDIPYRNRITQMYKEYVGVLGINLYEPTIIVVSETDPSELCVLPQVYTRFKTHISDGKSNRDAVPGAIARSAETTRDDLLLGATALDIMSVNDTKEQREYFSRVKMETAIIQKRFFERNLSPVKQVEITSQEQSSSPSDSNSSGMTFVLDDDD